MNVRDLIGKNIVIYDLEIKKPIEECSRGWASHDEMGISVGCAFDYRQMKYRVFMDDNIIQLVDRLNEPDTLVVAFNHINFDNILLRAVGLPLKEDAELNNYDMLLVSREGSGCNDKFAKGFKLDDHLHKLNLPVKTANGANAPIMYKEGRLGELVDYCLNDVTVERYLFENMIKNEKTACMYAADSYDIRLPIFKDIPKP